jgi:hypothetical protein
MSAIGRNSFIGWSGTGKSFRAPADTARLALWHSLPRNAPRVRVRTGCRDGFRLGERLPAPVAEIRDVQK